MAYFRIKDAGTGGIPQPAFVGGKTACLIECAFRDELSGMGTADDDVRTGAAVGVQPDVMWRGQLARRQIAPGVTSAQEDDLLPDAVRVVMESGQASISMIQRRLRVGYARAARLVDIMEQKKIVSGFDGSKPRRLLISQAEYAQMFGGADQAIQEDEE